MLRCCDFYCANLLEGMEGTELLKIETAGNDPITTTRLHNRAKREDVEYDNRGKKKKNNEELVLVVKGGPKDNKEIENLSSREMTSKKEGQQQPPPPPLSNTEPPLDNAKSQGGGGSVVLQPQVNGKPDDGCEKADHTKEETGSDSMKDDEESSRDHPVCNDVSKKSGASYDPDDVSYSEENSLDQNTFNIINTENSESQEYSELTNDDVSSPPPTDSKSAYKENGEEVNFRENGESEFGTQTEESADEISCLEELEEEEEIEVEEEELLVDDEVTEDSEGLSCSASDGEESDDEEDFDNDSLEETKSKTESTCTLSSKSPSVFDRTKPRELHRHNSVNSCTSTRSAPAKPTEAKPASPKSRHRPRLRSFGKKDTSEFKIEIFESKRKLPVPSIMIASDPGVCEAAGTSSDSFGLGLSKDASSRVSPTIGARSLDQLVTPDGLSSSSDFTTPDSADNTRSGMLDVSQPIGEESEESDRHSPIKPSPDGTLKTDFNRGFSDIDRKTSLSPDNKITSSVKPSAAPPVISNKPRSEEKKHPNGLLTSRSSSGTSNEGSHASPQTSSASEHHDEGENSAVTPPAEPKKPSPMAFTIELGGGGAAQTDAPKKLDITASISKWAPKHRRNLSLTKVEEHKVVENFFDENGNSRPKRRSTISRLDKVEERIGKPPVGRPRSGTIGATGLLQGRRAGGYHSEGYFSSDQDDETPRRTELKSPRSPRTPELRSPQTPQRLVRSTSQDSAKGASLKMRTPSPDSSSRASHAMTLNESASYLIEKMMSGTPETQRKQAGKPEGRSCCKGDKKPSVAEVTGRTKSEKGTKCTSKMTPEARKHSTSANSLSSGQTYDVQLGVGGNETGKEEKDDGSETGTYTIEKDSSSPEVEQARNDIDRVFGVSGTESEAETTPRGNAPSEETWKTTPEPDKFKSPSSISRNSPNWIQQWAAQVAEHTKTSDASSKASLGSPRGSKPPLASLSSSQESSESRPRRKLPTPPTHHHSFGLTSPRASDMSDHESPTKGRLLKDLYESPSMGQQNDYSRDTESFLRDTEQLVTSLQARMELKSGIRGSSFESHDSGGDSDLDTSTSYPINDDDDRLMKTFSSQQKAKLKLSGIDSTSRTPSVSASPRKADPLGLDSRHKIGGHFARERSIVSDSGYDIYSGSRDGEQCLQSDSSSETSEPLKDSRKTTDNNPPLKFNRAFSLRRARLGCDESTPSKSNLPVQEKKKVAQSSSVGISSATRKTPVSSSKSHQGSRGESQSQSSKSGANDFSRGDGGRFSLRLARSGSTNTVSKSPSHSSVRKEFSNGLRRAPRSNSTLSSKEVDFQNWKRRKNYDPMKAAAEGRKKVVEKKNEKNVQNNGHTSSSIRSPSPPVSLLRSASFHGTEGMGVGGRWPRRPNHLTTSEDDGPYSLEEEPQPVPHCSPLRRSPTSPHQLASSHITSPARQSTLSAARARKSSYALSDEGEAQGAGGSPARKPSLDESGSEGKRSPMGSSRGAVSSRSKTKMEALDNLVISTIHSLSVKVRTTSETLLQKLKSQYDEEGDRAALLEEVLAHLSESDQALSSSQSRSTSRELAGILRNLKKIEHALEVIDRVMVGDEEEDLDEDDLDRTGVHEWGESDY